MDKLKPCPFCGCEMEFKTVGRDWWRIRPIDGHADSCPFGELHEWDCSQREPQWEEEHAADWNARTNESQWISVADKPIPLDSFVQCSDGLMVVELSLDKYGDWTLPFNDYMPCDIDEVTNNITHWQPLPELPTAE